MPAVLDHPPDAALADFALGKLPDALDAAVERHLAGCSACQARAAAACPDDRLVALVATVAGRSDTLAPAPGDGTPPDVRPDAETRGWTPAAPGERPPPELADHPRYRLVRPLGAGGMGVVWLAEHTLMGRPVALKLIRPGLADRPGWVERFRREVRAAARLSHPNVAAAYDADEAGGVQFLVTEYVPGETLLDAVRRGPLPPDDACRAARDAARGLAHAHAAGLVHRDVKPGNLIRAADGAVKVLDFGLVVAAGGGDAELTGPNVVMGTPDVIAPEQAADPGTADARSDVYSLGCTLYHLLAGRPPYPGGSVLDKVAAHRDPARRPAPVPGLPAGLAEVVARMTAKRPADRYQTADAAAAALDPFCSADATPPPRRPRLRRAALAAAGAAAVLLFAGAVFTVRRGDAVVTVQTDDPDVEVVMKRNGELVRIVDTKANKTWELDTTTMRLSVGGEQTVDLPGAGPIVLRRGGVATVTITRGPADPAPAPAAAGAIREVRQFPGLTESVHAVAFSPDGKLVAAAGGSRWSSLFGAHEPGSDFTVRLWDAAGGKPVRTLVGHAAPVGCVAFSPDGKRVASSGGDRTVRVWDLATGSAAWVATQPDSVPGVAFTPDGRRVLAAGWRSPLRLYDAATGAAAGEFGPGPGPAAWGTAAFAPDGKLAAAGGWDALWLLDGATGGLVRRVAPVGRAGAASFSGDGSRVLATDVRDGAPATWRVRVWDAATGQEVWSAPGTAAAFLAADGSRVLASGVDDGRLSGWDVRTGAKLFEAAGHRSTVLSIVVSPDGRFAASGGLDNTARLWELPPARREPTARAETTAPTK